MDNFTYCFKHILLVEGSFSDHPDDSGGPTKWGITENILSEWRGHQVDSDAVKNMCPKEAEAVYQEWYWDAMRLYMIDEKVLALCLMDQGVNRGPMRAVRMMQGVANTYPGRKLHVDGIMGPVTAERLNKLDWEMVAFDFVQASQLEYVRICQANSKNLSFLAGWLNRTHLLQKTIFWDC